jgi:hypothetical protein
MVERLNKLPKLANPYTKPIIGNCLKCGKLGHYLMIIIKGYCRIHYIYQFDLLQEQHLRKLIPQLVG